MCTVVYSSPELTGDDALDVKMMEKSVRLGTRSHFLGLMAVERLVSFDGENETGDRHDTLKWRLGLLDTDNKRRLLRDALIKASRKKNTERGAAYIKELCRDYRRIAGLGPAVLDQVRCNDTLQTWRLTPVLRALRTAEEREFWADKPRQETLALLLSTADEWSPNKATNAEFYAELRSRAGGSSAQTPLLLAPLETHVATDSAAPGKHGQNQRRAKSTAPRPTVQGKCPEAKRLSSGPT
jgi:hypothetical protein